MNRRSFFGLIAGAALATTARVSGFGQTLLKTVDPIKAIATDSLDDIGSRYMSALVAAIKETREAMVNHILSAAYNGYVTDSQGLKWRKNKNGNWNIVDEVTYENDPSVDLVSFTPVDQSGLYRRRTVSSDPILRI